jgi:hypothetical protein
MINKIKRNACKWIYSGYGTGISLPFCRAFNVPTLPRGVLVGRVIYHVDEYELPDCNSNAWICSSIGFNLGVVQSRSRSYIRKGIRNNTLLIKTKLNVIDNQILNKIISETFTRQGRKDTKVFFKYIENLKNSAASDEKWGECIDVFTVKQEKVGALIIGMRNNNVYQILHQFSFTDQLSWHPNELITFLTSEYVFSNYSCKQVNYGVQGLDSGKLDGLSKFKKKMGFDLVPCKEKVVGKKIVIIPIRILFYFVKFIDKRLFKITKIRFVRLFFNFAKII